MRLERLEHWRLDWSNSSDISCNHISYNLNVHIAKDIRRKYKQFNTMTILLIFPELSIDDWLDMFR